MFLTLCVPFTAIDYAFPIWVLPTWTCNMINYLQVIVLLASKDSLPKIEPSPVFFFYLKNTSKNRKNYPDKFAALTLFLEFSNVLL